MKKTHSFLLILFLLVTSVSAYYNMYSGDDFENVIVNGNDINSVEEVIYSNDNVVYIDLDNYDNLEVFRKNNSNYYIYEGKTFEEEKIVRCYVDAPKGKLFYIKCPN